MDKSLDAGISKKETTIELYKAIRKEYFKMRDIKKGGVRLYSNEYILEVVGKKFFRSAKTVENIVSNRV